MAKEGQLQEEVEEFDLIKARLIMQAKFRARAKLTCRLWLLWWWISLQEWMIEEDIERHTFFGIPTQQAEQEIFEFRSRSGWYSTK